MRIVVISILVVSGCSKDSSPNTVPADAFVGTYNYTYTLDMLEPKTGIMTITKISGYRISTLTTQGTPTYYSVDGNVIIEDTNQTVDILLSSGKKVTFIESSKGTLVGDVLRINGAWSNSAYYTIFFSVVATKR
jgi:hypothetical protein